MKLIVTGQAQHGKDSVCEILQFLGLKFQSSSYFVGKKVVYPVLALKYDYSSFEECFADRGNHRDEWFQLIADYNLEDKTRLGKELFKEYDVYCGLRNRYEFLALKSENVFHASIWVEASRRKGKTEDERSLTISQDMCDYVIYNNSNKQALILNTLAIYNEIQEKFATTTFI
jgi:hypothetical protein